MKRATCSLFSAFLLEKCIDCFSQEGSQITDLFSTLDSNQAEPTLFRPPQAHCLATVPPGNRQDGLPTSPTSPTPSLRVRPRRAELVSSPRARPGRAAARRSRCSSSWRCGRAARTSCPHPTGRRRAGSREEHAAGHGGHGGPTGLVRVDREGTAHWAAAGGVREMVLKKTMLETEPCLVVDGPKGEERAGKGGAIVAIECQ